MLKPYDVIIVGGGPVGVALGIELGLQNIHTLILEKYEHPLLSPRAQSLTTRSMEFFLRWGINKALRAKQVFPENFNMQGVWCSDLNGKTYGCASSEENMTPDLSPEKPIRIPLWLTEETLRDRLADFDCVTLLKNHEVTDITVEDKLCSVTAFDRNTQQDIIFTATYIAACDGANSLIRQACGIKFEALAPPRHILNLLFKAPTLLENKTVAEGFIYFLLNGRYSGATGIIDPSAGIWYAQIFFDDFNTTITDINIAEVLHSLTGMQFNFELLNAHFWTMQIQLAKQYTFNDRVFLLGDSAHAFAPTGGFGLNTGFGDVNNLAWKLADVIHQQAPTTLLSTYEKERRPIAKRNLRIAEKNAHDAVNLKKKHNPLDDPEGFAKANQELAKQHIGSDGLMMGYTYVGNSEQLTSYTPTPEPGYFLPHKTIGDKTIYQCLSSTQWTLISADTNITSQLQLIAEKYALSTDNINTLIVPEGTYPNNLLIRPDWHIAFTF